LLHLAADHLGHFVVSEFDEHAATFVVCLTLYRVHARFDGGIFRIPHRCQKPAQGELAHIIAATHRRAQIFVELFFQ
jgi:hypothetical protein